MDVKEGLELPSEPRRINRATTIAAIIFTCGLIAGTGSTITIKIVYGLSSVGNDGNDVKFEKPLTTTWVMFLAMMCALPVHFLCRALFGQSPGEDVERLVINGREVIRPYKTPTKIYFMTIIPAIFDLIGTALAKVGLLFISVSVYQLIRSTTVVFCAILNITVLKKIRSFEFLGVFIITVAMCLISLSSLINDDSGASDDSTRKPLQGILFLLGSCSVCALQYVFEEKVMVSEDSSTEGSCPPLVLVGLEGVWGTLLMWGVVFPWAYTLPGNDKGSMENVFDSWTMIKNSPNVQYMLFGFFITVMLYNIMGILVTKLGSSMWHTILDSFRPVSVWGTDLFIFYVLTAGAFGESWTTCSYIQLAGVFILLLGTAVYQGKLHIRGMSYDPVPPCDQMPIITP